jgi:hypothetical protein
VLQLLQAPTAKVQPLINFSSGQKTGCTGGVSVTNAAKQPVAGAWVRVRIGTATLEGVTSRTGNFLQLGPLTGTGCAVTVFEVRPEGKTGECVWRGVGKGAAIVECPPGVF